MLTTLSDTQEAIRDAVRKRYAICINTRTLDVRNSHIAHRRLGSLDLTSSTIATTHPSRRYNKREHSDHETLAHENERLVNDDSSLALGQQVRDEAPCPMKKPIYSYDRIQ